ncbi:hypothetical protein GWI33_012728 [Rhynchophorus ferrugineus]|uniref:Uncharacterized protein n=1 Tax=Rhynchophorus ferrugineus TaxID=354439 RepID=A0A834II83_RHYFE|nr:hypothetical protein GWI33_012728 [Rhynchophorus ferrugineus]
MLAASKEHVPNDNVLRNKALRQSTITKYFVESGMPSEKEMNKNRSDDITMWNPFNDSTKEHSPVIETWGKMVYRQSPLRHHQRK